MPKKRSTKETLAAWRQAEEAFAHAIAPYLDAGANSKLTKDDAVLVTKVRSRADRRMHQYFKRAL